jgi:hypothetical protein
MSGSGLSTEAVDKSVNCLGQRGVFPHYSVAINGLIKNCSVTNKLQLKQLFIAVIVSSMSADVAVIQ